MVDFVVMGRPIIDLTGERFGRLVVIEIAYRPWRSPASEWECICDCGTGIRVRASCLKTGSQRSCGCLRRTATITHGKSRTPEYRTWSGMKYRCDRADDPWYGSRGIRVCKRWSESFESFLEDVGPRPSPAHSIDRIDPDGHYEPDNVRWATAK